MDEAGEAPENMEALKTAVMEKLSEWYMRNHGVGTMANVEDMCTLLQVRPHFFWFLCRFGGTLAKNSEQRKNCAFLTAVPRPRNAVTSDESVGAECFEALKASHPMISKVHNSSTVPLVSLCRNYFVHHPDSIETGEQRKAYWNVATKRLVDNVCMTMEQDFVVKLLGKVESELFLLTNRFTDVEELFVEVRMHTRACTRAESRFFFVVLFL